VSDAAPWFDDDGPSASRPRRTGVALAIAAPWMVAAAVLVHGATADADGPSATAAEDVGPEGADDLSDPEDPAVEPADVADPDVPGSAGPHHETPSAGAPAAGPRDVDPRVVDGPTTADARTLATIVARAWLSGTGPDLDVPGITPQRGVYLEHVAAGAVEVPGADTAVVTVHLVLLGSSEDRYDEVVVRRAAVPLTVTDDEVHPAGPPWWLPDPPVLTSHLPETVPLDDPDLLAEVTATLADAGVDDAEVIELGRGQGDLLVASVRGAGPHGPVDGDLWLTQATGTPRVLGVAPPPDGTRPASDPADHPADDDHPTDDDHQTNDDHPTDDPDPTDAPDPTDDEGSP
jgi:hypothetical protein